jgi:RimJ/RimL family protein N-acetyltransferase
VPTFPEATIGTGRLLLTPLDPGDADELVAVLADPELHRFVGGRPATLQELRTRYTALQDGSGRPEEVWRNWVVRRRADARPVGTVQATIGRRPGGWTAEIAWVVGVPWQGRGYASEAARALVGWLGRQDVHEIAAHIHPDHLASAKVASRAGLRPTRDEVDGERVWRRAGHGTAVRRSGSAAAPPAAAALDPGHGAEGLGEVGRGQPHGLALDPLQQPPPGPAGHLGLDVAARPPVRLADLGRVVGDVAPEQDGVVPGGDQQALGAGGVARAVEQA